jgi:hypothetical protein
MPVARPACRALSILVAMSVAPVWAAADTSCLIMKKDVGALDPRPSSNGDLGRANAIVVSPCTGRARSPLYLMYEYEPGKLRARLVSANQSIEEVVGRETMLPLTNEGTWWRRLLAAIEKPLRSGPGESQFDSRYGILLEGMILPGRDVPVVLERFNWNPSTPVVMKDETGKARTLQPVGGVLTIPAAAMKVGVYTLQQGRLSAPIEIPAESELEDLRKELRVIEQEQSDPDAKRLRRAILLSENNFILNLVAEYANP